MTSEAKPKGRRTIQTKEGRKVGLGDLVSSAFSEGSKTRSHLGNRKGEKKK